MSEKDSKAPQAAEGQTVEEPEKPVSYAAESVLPFSRMSGDEFEKFCFSLVLEEPDTEAANPYGGPGDKGRDVVRELTTGEVEFIQCKSYSGSVGVGDIRTDLAKLCANAFEAQFPKEPDRIVCNRSAPTSQRSAFLRGS